jgi:hypothetical protein
VSLSPKKSLGQHFLVDDNILDVIGRLAELEPDDVVLEVGPGLGVLTRYLSERVAFVHAAEVDRRLWAHLDGIANTEVHSGDALRLDVAFELTVDHPQRTLILTGGPLANGPGTEAEHMARYLIDKGLPSQQLLLEQQARNTRENISNSCVLATRESLSGQRCVLTSDYHLYRAVREGRAIGVELTPIPAPVPLPGRLQQWSREVLTILAAR